MSIKDIDKSKQAQQHSHFESVYHVDSTYVSVFKNENTLHFSNDLI